MATNSKKTGTAAKIGVMTLAIMNVAAVVSLRVVCRQKPNMA